MSAAFFDLDGTLWSVSGEKAFARQLRAQGLFSRRQMAGVAFNYLRYELGLIRDYDALKTRALRGLFTGLETAPIETLYAEFYAGELRGRLFPALRERVAEHRRAGDRVVIVSASLGFMVATVAAELEADAWYGTCLAAEAGRYTGEVRGRIHYGAAKAEAVREYATARGFELARCHAYGDRLEDRHMLECVGHPVAVNPDRRLAALAERRRWEVLRTSPAA